MKPDTIHSAFAPGRVEILGNHTDYNDGLVLSAALQLGITCTGSATLDGSIQLESKGNRSKFCLGPEDPLLPNATWVDYPLGVANALRDAGYPCSGFSCRYDSTLPSGAGLSSSAALEVSTALFLSRVFGFSLEPLTLAKLCKQAENEFVGVNCGLLDQVSSVFGKKDHLVYLDCRSESVERIPMPTGVVLLIINSAVKHALTGGEYNERREQCFAAASALGVPALRDTTTKELQAAGLPEIILRRATHITGENERVLQGKGFLASGDLERFGQLMFQSHQSSRDNFENSTKELDLLVELAAKTKGVLGSRLTGGGFGGATVSLVLEQDAQNALETISEAYQDLSGNIPDGFLCNIARGAVDC